MNGFETPMRIFLFAERYNYGVVEERYMLAEVIDGVPLHSCWRELKKEIFQTVLRMHQFKLGWGGDPNPGNFLLTKDRKLRAIDIGFGRPSWINQGKDLYCLDWLFDIKDGKFRLKTLAAKIQSDIKRKGPHGKNGAKALKRRLEEDEKLGLMNKK